MSGFSKSDANAIIRRALEPNIRKILCALGASTTTNIAPTLTSTSGAGSTAAGVYKVTFTNTGGAGGTVAGTTIASGTSVTFEGYLDPENGQFKRLDSIAYDATGTTFLIAITP